MEKSRRYISESIQVREAFYVKEHLQEVQLSALKDNNSDGEKPFLYLSVYSEHYPLLSVYISLSYEADLCGNHCCSRKIK